MAGHDSRFLAVFGTDRAIRGDGGERDVWRFLVLPQLIETVSQAFVPELLIAKLRQTWIQDNLPIVPRMKSLKPSAISTGF